MAADIDGEADHDHGSACDVALSADGAILAVAAERMPTLPERAARATCASTRGTAPPYAWVPRGQDLEGEAAA